MKNIMIDKTKTALVVIDLQKGIVGMPTEPYPTKTVVANAAKLAKAFRKNRMPVFLVHVMISADGKDALRPIVDSNMQWNRKMSPDWADIVPELGPEKSDFIITKHQSGAFYGTELDLQLRRRGITTIVLCGIATHIGVESTARFAYEYGYSQIFAEDAMSAMSAEEHTFTITKIFPRMGLVRKTEDVLADLSHV
jgi:nicotinamidase-related amidase